MKLKDIIDVSCFGTIATVVDEESLNKLHFFISHNKEFINSFKRVILSLNYLKTTPHEVIDEYKKIWSVNVPNSIILSSMENRGHMFGTIDLEETILKHVKDNFKETRYLWKSMDDILLSEDMFEIDVEEAGFYYIPGFSYESIIKAGGKDELFKNYENYESGFWTPQTTFFILDINCCSSLYGSDISDKYKIYLELKKGNPEIKPWEIPFDIKFDCETHLGRTTKSLKKYCLIGKSFKDLLNFVDNHNVGDPSHKNIYFTNLNLCHYHFYTDVVFHI